MSQASLLPPRITFAIEETAEIEVPGYRGYDSVPLRRRPRKIGSPVARSIRSYPYSVQE